MIYGIVFATAWLIWPRALDSVDDFGDGMYSVPEYKMYKSRYVSVHESEVELEYFSDETSYRHQAKQLDSKNVYALVYDGHDHATKVWADHSQFQTDARVMKLDKNVRSESPDGFKTRGEDATYNLDTKAFVAETPIEGETIKGELKVWGDSAQGNINSNSLRLIGSAKAQYNEGRHGITTILGDFAEIRRTNYEAEFWQNVRMLQNDIEGTSKRATLYYEKAPNSLKYFVARDDVVIKEKGGKITRSQVAEFDAKRDTVVLTGFPSVQNGDDTMLGDKITLYRATGLVETTGANAAVSEQGLGLKSEVKTKKSSNKQSNPEDDELIP